MDPEYQPKKRRSNPNARINPKGSGWLIDCDVCGKETEVKTEWARFCSSSCRQKHHRQKHKADAV